MATRLRPSDDLTPELVKQYDLSSAFPLSRNMLLSPNGVVRGSAADVLAATAGGHRGRAVGASVDYAAAEGPDDSPRFTPRASGTEDASSPCTTSRVEAAAPVAASTAEIGRGEGVRCGGQEPKLSSCLTCLASLERLNRNSTPPRLALANGNATGRLPDNLRDTTSTEFNLVSTVSVRAAVTFLRGGGEAALQAHTLLIDTRPTPPAVKLPRVFWNSDTDGIVRVVFTSRLCQPRRSWRRGGRFRCGEGELRSSSSGSRPITTCTRASPSRPPPSMSFLEQRPVPCRTGSLLTPMTAIYAARRVLRQTEGRRRCHRRWRVVEKRRPRWLGAAT